MTLGEYPGVGSNRHGTDRTRSEILPFNSKSMIEASTVVFPCDGRGQFHELGFAESLAQTRKQCVGDFDGNPSHAIRILEDKPLKF